MDGPGILNSTRSGHAAGAVAWALLAGSMSGVLLLAVSSFSPTPLTPVFGRYTFGVLAFAVVATAVFGIYLLAISQVDGESASLSREEQARIRDLKTTSRWIFFALASGLAFIIGRFIVASVTLDRARGLSAIQGKACISMLWALGWFAVAFLFGFIFGIPKALQGGNQKPSLDKNSPTAPSNESTASSSSSSTVSLKVNTNLEEISDWLTKILVGATLSQLTKIPGLVQNAARYMVVGLGQGELESFAAAIIVYFSSLGFLAGYLLTRMFFALAFARADSVPRQFPQLAPLSDTSVSLGRPDATLSRDVWNTVRELGNVHLSDSLTPTQAVGVAKAAILSSDVQRALSAARLAVSKSPDDPEAHLNLAIAVHDARGSDEEVTKELELARTLAVKNPSVDLQAIEDIYNSIVYLALYLEPPDGFERAISYGNEFLAKFAPADFSILVNLACAYAQNYKFLTEKPEAEQDVTTMRDVRHRSLDLVEKAIRLGSSARIRLSELLHGTGADPADDDLKIFENDPEFQKAIDTRS